MRFYQQEVLYQVKESLGWGHYTWEINSKSSNRYSNFVILPVLCPIMLRICKLIGVQLPLHTQMSIWWLFTSPLATLHPALLQKRKQLKDNNWTDITWPISSIYPTYYKGNQSTYKKERKKKKKKVQKQDKNSTIKSCLHFSVMGSFLFTTLVRP